MINFWKPPCIVLRNKTLKKLCFFYVTVYVCFDIYYFLLLWGSWCLTRKAASRIPIFVLNLILIITSHLVDKPEVWLSPEGRDNNSAIKLGDDVALKCTIVANPGHHTIIWTKKVETIFSSVLTVSVVWSRVLL